MARPRITRPRRSRTSQNSQMLVYPCTAFVNAAPKIFTAANIKLDQNRPAIVRSVTFSYVRGPVAAITLPPGFSIKLHSASGEEINISPALIPSVTKQSFTLRAPKNTDFGTFAANSPVVTFVNAVGLAFTMSVRVSYKLDQLNVIT